MINVPELLQKYIEKEVELWVTLGEESKIVKGKLLGFRDGVILATSNGIQTFKNPDGVRFPSLP